jgi:hypothetical protein
MCCLGLERLISLLAPQHAPLGRGTTVFYLPRAARGATEENGRATTMTTPTSIVADFTDLFGEQPNGCDAVKVSHCKESPRIVTLCRAALGCETSDLFDYFKKWDDSKDGLKPRDIEYQLACMGRWEAAWSLARVHVDQVAKQEQATGQRVADKGHPLCNVALVGHDLGCRAIVQHYGQLSSAGDLYRAAGIGPADHGLAPVLLEPYESRKRHEAWRETVQKRIAAVAATQPLFLEAYVAARWFRGKHQNPIIDLAPMEAGKSASFVEVLLAAAAEIGKKKDMTSGDTTNQGTLFEAATGLVLSATPGFTVYSCRWDKDEQIDLVVRYEPDGLAPPCLPQGYGLVECKAEKGAVDSATLRDFGTKCLFHRVEFGILVAKEGLKGARTVYTDLKGAELVRRRFLSEGLTLLVLDMDDLNGRPDRELRGLHDALFDDYQELVFGKIVGEA